MNESFEEMTADLSRFTEIESPLAVDASVSSGFMVHKPECECTGETKLIVIKLEFIGDDFMEFCVPVDSPLGRALTTGQMQATCLEKLAEIA